MRNILSVASAAAAFALGGFDGAPYHNIGGYRKGPTPNKYSPRPTKVKNPKIAAQVNEMHDKWFGRFPVFPMRMLPDPNSITQIKLRLGVHRAVAREHHRVLAAK